MKLRSKLYRRAAQDDLTNADCILRNIVTLIAEVDQEEVELIEKKVDDLISKIRHRLNVAGAVAAKSETSLSSVRALKKAQSGRRAS